MTGRIEDFQFANEKTTEKAQERFNQARVQKSSENLRGPTYTCAIHVGPLGDSLKTAPVLSPTFFW